MEFFMKQMADTGKAIKVSIYPILTLVQNKRHAMHVETASTRWARKLKLKQTNGCLNVTRSDSR